MWKLFKRKSFNYVGVPTILYRCDDEDLGIKPVSSRKQRQKAYHQIFQQQATVNMKDRLENFSQFQTQLKQ